MDDQEDKKYVQEESNDKEEEEKVYDNDLEPEPGTSVNENDQEGEEEEGEGEGDGNEELETTTPNKEDNYQVPTLTILTSHSPRVPKNLLAYRSEPYYRGNKSPTTHRRHRASSPAFTDLGRGFETLGSSTRSYLDILF